jgi:hypothetical protein
MAGQEAKLNAKRVRRLFREDAGLDKSVRISGSATEMLANLCTEFVEVMSLAALDRSERPKQYVDSVGLLNALRDLGFPEIADELPDWSEYTEDMQKV